jgi:hypothetical protein
MPIENPWAYSEANNRIREQGEKEKIVIEEKKEHFEKTKERIRKKKTLDVFELKRHIETGHSLEDLKESIKQALKEGSISIDTYQKTLDALNQDVIHIEWNKNSTLSVDPVPFSQNALAKYLEEAKLGENVLVDMVWVFYGFVVQWSAILVILAWKIFTDLLFLPRDIYQELKK